MMRILIVDDEPQARNGLTQILNKRADVDLLDSAADAIEAQDRLRKGSYDVMLLDINMPEMSGLELMDSLQHSDKPLPAIVFVTAYAQHAVAAFEKHAADYVLKPLSPDRVNEAVDFAYRRTTSERASKLMELLPDLRMLPRERISKIGIKTNGRILFIDPQEVMVVEAKGGYVLLEQESGSSYLLRESISKTEEQLKACGFVRIHRSVLVNPSYVQQLRPVRATGEYELLLKNGRKFTVTRTFKRNLVTLTRLWIGTGTF
jgi:two-component system LytT family response regulator